MSVILILADGARADTLANASASPEFPALTRLRAEGAAHVITTVFPSVTGPAYAPFLTGRHPAPIGLPGLRWFDRARTRCVIPPHCRSYLGKEMRHLDGDLDAHAHTLFELAASRFNAMSMLGRGARGRDQIGRGLGLLARVALTHWRGRVASWLALDRRIGARVARHIRAHRPEVAFVALLGLDKASHAAGQHSDSARAALRVLDDTVAELRHDAERAGVWEQTHLWVVSDHGHSRVDAHDDLAGSMRDAGCRVIAHPWVFTRRADAAVMVSGNAMAHLYLEPARRARPWWPALASRWEHLVDALLERPSVDVVLLPHSATRCEVRARGRGRAWVTVDDGRVSYRPDSGDPLAVGELARLDAASAYDATIASTYPDALVQIAQLAGAARAGDVILSAAAGWDFRERFEPVPHVSTHGALLRDHMLVPLITNHPVARRPRRTVDVMPSALRALRIGIPPSVEGVAFN